MISRSHRLITTVATPLPIRFVIARHSLIKRSIPTSSASDDSGIVGTTANVAASVTKPAPVTPLEDAVSDYVRHYLVPDQRLDPAVA